jgi:CheY-like chemotaxis protein
MHPIETAGVHTELVGAPELGSVSLPEFVSTPVNHDGQVPSVVPPPAMAGEEPLPILVADDDEDDVFFIQRLIRKTGVKNPVKVFNDGSEVVNYLGARMACAQGRQRLPQLLFLDLKMAGLGGFGFLEWARQHPALQPLTIVVLSNSSVPADVARAHELGAHRYLVKYPCVQTITTIVRSVYPFTLA